MLNLNEMVLVKTTTLRQYERQSPSVPVPDTWLEEFSFDSKTEIKIYRIPKSAWLLVVPVAPLEQKT